MSINPAGDRSRQYRASQTARNLVAALLACVGLVALVMIVFPRTDSVLDRTVDVAKTASEAQPSTTMTLAVPVLPDGWTANDVQWNAAPSAADAEWRVSYITADKHSIVLRQALSPAGSWAFQTLQNRNPTGSVEIDGTTWIEYDYRDQTPADNGQVSYGIVAELPDTVSLALYGNATADEFATLARSAIASIAANNPSAVAPSS